MMPTQMTVRPTRPIRPTRQKEQTAAANTTSTARDLQRMAYSMGADAAFDTGDGCMAADGALDAYDHAAGELVRRCEAAGVEGDARERVYNALLLGFTSTRIPRDALVRVFTCIRQHEAKGVLPCAPLLLTRSNPMVTPRLFWAAVMLGYADTVDADGRQFPFACTAVATAYAQVFGETIYPTTVMSFTRNALLLGLLIRTRKGTRGPNGKPSYYALTDRARPQAWGMPDDMLLRQLWERQRAEKRSGEIWR